MSIKEGLHISPSHCVENTRASVYKLDRNVKKNPRMIILGPIIVVLLMAVAIQNASCAADPHVSFTKTVAPVTPAECNKWLVTVTAAGVDPVTKPVDVLLVIDRSGSMAFGSPTRLSSAKSAAINFANLILAPGNPGNRIGVVSFASDVTTNTGFTTSLTTVTTAINSLNANGGTNTENAFDVAGGLFPATPPCDRVQVLIFLSDGVPTVGSLQNCGFDGDSCDGGYCGAYTTYPCTRDCCNYPGGPNCCTNGAIYRSATAKARANVYSIGLVTGMTTPTLTVAREVFNRVQDSGYYEAPSPSDLNNIYAQIAGQLQLAVTSGAVTENIDSVGTDFNIVGTPTTTAGTATVSGNVITWNGFNVAFGTPATMTYTITPKSGVCGDQILGGSSMTYTTVSCTSNTLTATSAPTSASVTCLTAAISPVPTAVCQGSTLQLNGNPSLNGVPLADGAAGYTHKWTGTGAIYLTADNIQKPIFQSNAPAGSYTLIYTVTDSRGCTATDTNTITVYSRPTAAISPTSVCQGTALPLNGNPSGGSGSYTTHVWTGDITHLSASNIQNPILLATAPAGTYSLTYTVTDSRGCTGTDTKTITVHSRPTASITPDPAEVCQGSTLPLNGNPSGGSGSYTTHLWTGTGTAYLSAANIQNPTFLGTAPAGTYDLTYTITDSRGCQGSDAITVTVYSRPSASISPTSVCQGTALPLNGNPSGGSGSYTTHVWTGDIMHLSATNIQNPILLATAPAGTYSLTYTVTDSRGCIGTDTKTITVHSRPIASITPDPAEVCQGSTLQLNGNPSGGSGSYTTHAWTGAGAAYLSATNVQNPTFQGTATAGTYSLTYTVTDSNGCIGTDTITVKVGAKPTVAAGPDQSICIEDDAQTVKLTATATDYDSIVWTQESGPGTFDPGSNELEIIFHPDYDSSIAYSETVFKVQAIAQSPCTGTETASDYVTVMVSMKPETDILVTF